MKGLDKNWLTNGLIDFEYKKYVFLSYLTYVKEQFTDNKIYPVLSEIHEHHRQLIEYKEMKNQLRSQFPKKICGIDLGAKRLIYEKMICDNDLINEIDEIVNFSLSHLNRQLAIGLELLEFIMEQISVEPIGISPVNKNEGYLIFLYHHSKEVRIYKYEVSLVIGLAHQRQILTYFLESTRISIANSPEQIKKDLLKKYRTIPNPATFSVSTRLDIPYDEAFYPIGKEILSKTLAA